MQTALFCYVFSQVSLPESFERFARHNQLWDRADPDTSFLSSPQPEITVHLECHFNLRSVLLDLSTMN